MCVCVSVCVALYSLCLGVSSSGPGFVRLSGVWAAVVSGRGQAPGARDLSVFLLRGARTEGEGVVCQVSGSAAVCVPCGMEVWEVFLDCCTPGLGSVSCGGGLTLAAAELSSRTSASSHQNESRGRLGRGSQQLTLAARVLELKTWTARHPKKWPGWVWEAWWDGGFSR